MSDSQTQKVIIEDGDEQLEIGIFTQNPVDFLPSDTGDDDEYSSKNATDIVKTSMQEVHKYIRFYTKYAIGAFKHFGEGEIEEINLKFGLKIGGKTGLPMVAEGSTDADFQIEVKCKFPTNNT